MARLTQEEIEKLRVWADGAPRPGLAALVVRALDELEEHRAREGQVERDGALLSEEAVETIRNAMECVRHPELAFAGTLKLIERALALLPSKREPTLLDLAQRIVDPSRRSDPISGVLLPYSEIEALRAAVERESKR